MGIWRDVRYACSRASWWLSRRTSTKAVATTFGSRQDAQYVHAGTLPEPALYVSFWQLPPHSIATSRSAVGRCPRGSTTHSVACASRARSWLMRARSRCS
jgi:hypothetical protein